jgi:hypothetical protein
MNEARVRYDLKESFLFVFFQVAQNNDRRAP